MKVVQFKAPGMIAIVESGQPPIGPDEVLVRSRRVGICHSDLELLDGRYILPFSYPITPGHEWVGEVVEVGANVTSVSAGDRVVGECVVGPGGRDHFGFTINGAAAQYFRVRAEWLHKVPEELSDAQAALVEPFSVAYNAIRAIGGPDPSDTIAVIGAGPIGLLATMAATATNARVIAIESKERRRKLALEVGATDALDPATDTFEAQVTEITQGRGFDAVIEAAGTPAAMSLALQVAGQHGRLAYLGISVNTMAPAALGLIQSKSLQIRGVVGSMGVWPQTIRFLARKVADPSRIVTTTFPLDRAPEAYAAARDIEGNIKVHIQVAP
jgi:L-iditol 2-dehydrogenase